MSNLELQSNPLESEIPKTEEVKESSNLSPEQQELQNKINHLEDLLDTYKLHEKFGKNTAKYLQERLTSDPSIQHDPEAKPTIDMFNDHMKIYKNAVKNERETEAKIAELTVQLTQLTDSIEYSAGLDMDDNGEIIELQYSPEELKTISSREFLSIDASERLQYVTTNNIDAENIASGAVDNLEFSFTFEGEFNDELYMLTTAGQVLPEQVRTVVSEGVEYSRNGLNGEFYNGDSRLIIREGTDISITELGTEQELSLMEQKNKQKFDSFMEQNPEYASEIYTEVVNELIVKGIENPEEIRYILNGDANEIKDSSVENLEKLLTVSTYLKNGGFLDDFSEVGDLITNLEKLIQILDTYGSALSYEIDSSGNISFNLDKNGLPEGIESKELSLEKFSQIALSQLGTSEYNGGADKYLRDLGYGGLNSRNTPWCAAFVNWALMQAGYKGTGNLLAKSFIGEGGYGHVGIKLGDKLLGGNQGNKVSLMDIKKPIAGYAIPTENGLEVTKPAGDRDSIPDGAILVFDRNTKKDRQFA